MPLTIQYCSDLHLEFDLNKKWVAKYPLVVSGDILLLGGDIVPFDQIAQHAAFFDQVAANYSAVYWIPGNHEYYGADINERSGILHEAIRPNVFLVNDTTITIGDVHMICATLWSHLDPVNEYDLTRGMRDLHLINDGMGKWSLAAYNKLHVQGLRYIADAISKSKAAATIVLTHHMPTMMNYPAKYKGEVMNQAFATELHDLIYGSDVACWLYGHTHYNTPDFMIGNTRLLTNQLGYVRHGEHTTFQRDEVIKF